MHKEVHVGPFGGSVTLGRYQRVKGVCSRLEDGQHFLMWDFDSHDYHRVRLALVQIQELYQLPAIYVIKTSKAGKYHAYCFAHHSFEATIQILASTQCIDVQYLAIGILRGYWTLRISPKRWRNGSPTKFEHEGKLISKYPDTVNPQEACMFVSYWTRVD